MVVFNFAGISHPGWRGAARALVAASAMHKNPEAKFIWMGRYVAGFFSGLILISFTCLSFPKGACVLPL